jgi:curved DNA-binding protein CbpA
MALDPDPYRILELPPGATLDEVKRAYRRLAKVHHPDAAGEAALPRFLAIQAAYEQLLTGASPGARGRRAPGGPRRAWEADPDRSDATRRAYGGRARSAPAGGATPGGGARPRPSGPPGEGGGTRSEGPAGAGSSHGPSGPAGSAGTAGPAANGAGAGSDGAASGTGPAGAAGSGSRGPTSGRSRRRRTTGDGSGPDQATPPNPDAGRSRRTKRNKATLGSTSYDGADGPFEPDWRGASWYGTTSGTYWTLNPKEYADPRKHGPEYQARARRAARAQAAARAGASADPVAEEAEAPDRVAADTEADASATTGPEAREPGAAGAGGRPGPAHTTASWWETSIGSEPASSTEADAAPRPAGAQAGAAAAAGAAGATGTAARPTRPARPAHPAGGDVDPPPPDLAAAATDLGRALTDERTAHGRWRLVQAVVAWLPIAFGLGWLAGEQTGCGRAAASCDGVDPFLGPVLVLLALGVLLLVPRLAAIAAAVLSATGDGTPSEGRSVALGLILVLAWLAGLSIAIARRWRVAPSSPVGPDGPVS